MASIAAPRARERLDRLERIWAEPPGLVGWLTTVDHKRIGLMFFFTSLVFFAAGGVEALAIRTQLIRPDNGLLSPNAFDEAMTMHGITMIFLVVVPMSIGAFGNYLLPLMIGARDLAFPRLNALSFWVYLASGLFVYTGVAIGSAPNAGWFDYLPLGSKQFEPGPNIDFYTLGLIFTGVSTTATAINLIVTTFKLRAPGMSLNRMPLFCYAMLATSFALVFALPPLNTALIFLELDRSLGFHFFDVAKGGDTLLWQHLFWIFGHPEVYIIILPAFGIATAIIPTFARRRMVAFPLVALAEMLVAFIGFGVWAHHMFAVGLDTITEIYFAAASLIIVIPSGIQLFAWITTIVTGTPRFKTPLLWIVGFIVLFLLGGLSGVTFAAIPFDQQLTDTYYVVAHFHYVIFGAAVFPLIGGVYYWFPKVTGRLYHERAGQASFWLTFTGMNLTFFPMHILGLLGMPRRQYTYSGGLGWTGYNLVETLGSYVLTAGLLLVVANLVISLFRGEPAGNDPWGGDTLEWSTSSPPPPYNYAVIPRVSSPYAMWDREDREADIRDLAGPGERVLEGGHETPASSTLDADLDEILEMPSQSWAPLVLAIVLAGGFTMLLTRHYIVAAVLALLALLVIAAWHWGEATARVVRRGISFPLGWWGIVLLVATETAFFGTLIASYFYLRLQDAQWPPPGIEPPDMTAPLILTAVLVATAVPIFFAVRAARAERLRPAWLLLLTAVVVQAVYLGVQIHLFGSDLDKFQPGDNAYGSIYFTLLGAHHLHVLVGILMLVWLLARLPAGLTNYRVVAVWAVAIYWYFVALAGVAVVLTQVSPSL